MQILKHIHTWLSCTGVENECPCWVLPTMPNQGSKPNDLSLIAYLTAVTSQGQGWRTSTTQTSVTWLWNICIARSSGPTLFQTWADMWVHTIQLNQCGKLATTRHVRIQGVNMNQPSLFESRLCCCWSHGGTRFRILGKPGGMQTDHWYGMIMTWYHILLHERPPKNPSFKPVIQ